MNLGKPNPRLRLFPFQATFPYSVPSTHGRAGSPPSGAGGDGHSSPSHPDVQSGEEANVF